MRSATLSAVTPIEGGAAAASSTVDGFVETTGGPPPPVLNGVAPKYFETLAHTPRGRARLRVRRRGPAARGDRQPGDGAVLLRWRQSSRTASDVRSRDRAATRSSGVVGDAKYDDLHERRRARSTSTRFRRRRIDLAVRASDRRAADAVAPQVRRAVAGGVKTVPVAKVTTLAEQVDASLVPERVMAMLSDAVRGARGAAGGDWAVWRAGLHGDAPHQRDWRAAWRSARHGRDVTRMVLKSALGLVCAGLVVGAPFAVWSQRFAASVVGKLRVGIALRSASPRSRCSRSRCSPPTYPRGAPLACIRWTPCATRRR